MYTSSALLLMGAAICGQATSPSWLDHYSTARARGVEAGRSLAVFVGKGKAGAAQCCRDGKLSDAAEKLLAKHYVCVYVDVEKPSNKWLADAFAFTKGNGVALSDRSGNIQTFYHDGEVSAAKLLDALRAGAGIADETAKGVLAFTAANFDAAVLKSKQPVLVDFYADWCGPCQRMQPVMSALCADCNEIAKVGKLNTDQNRAIASEYGVSAIPAFLIFQNGRVVDRVVGATSKEDLAARIKAVLK
jgi:thioredoxin 1